MIQKYSFILYKQGNDNTLFKANLPNTTTKNQKSFWKNHFFDSSKNFY